MRIAAMLLLCCACSGCLSGARATDHARAVPEQVAQHQQHSGGARISVGVSTDVLQWVLDNWPAILAIAAGGAGAFKLGHVRGQRKAGAR